MKSRFACPQCLKVTQWEYKKTEDGVKGGLITCLSCGTAIRLQTPFLKTDHGVARMSYTDPLLN